MEGKSDLSHSTIDCKQQKKAEASILKCQNTKNTSEDDQKPRESSMVSQLHNQGQDQFVHTCNNCESTVETRYYCVVCDDFKLCIKCYNSDEHEMQSLEFELGGDSNGGDQKQVDPQEQSLDIQRCIRNLEHACQCRDANCRFSNCQMMKRIVSHAKICTRKWDGSCSICRQLIGMICYHAGKCQETNCLVPFCLKVKNRLIQVQAVSTSRIVQRMVASTGLPSQSVGMRPQSHVMAANNMPDSFLVQFDRLLYVTMLTLLRSN